MILKFGLWKEVIERERTCTLPWDNRGYCLDFECSGYGSKKKGGNMKDRDKTPISQASTIEEIADFRDTHSLADYWDQTREVEAEILVQRRPRVVIDPEVYERLVQIARQRGLHPETLINVWLAERLAQEKAA